ncbi:MAG TPA: hypothetical protein VKG23_16570 [Thermoanaerobaculia bacterium]|nr:hypothetical protein [Thermoanaerobaculia bacterium]
MKRKQSALVEFAPGFLAAAETLHVFGVTPEGSVPLRLETVPGWRERVRLPACACAPCPPESLEDVHERLRRETGLIAEELVVMSRYGIPTGHRGRAAILLAPRVRVPHACAAGLVVLPLGDVAGFLEDRRRAGGSVDLIVRVGLRMAEKHYPRWAQGRLKRAIEELHWRQRVPETGAGAAMRRSGAHG